MSENVTITIVYENNEIKEPKQNLQKMQQLKFAKIKQDIERRFKK